MTKTKTEHENKLDHVATTAKDGAAAVAITAKEIAARVAPAANAVVDATKQKAKDAKRAVRDAALHTNDTFEDLKDKLD
jgi:hypothetical protein